ncbi:MAG: murein biosynthesis integral membrane protein MurJ [Candidatus Omnitrophica bacterium]|nr:murein biosynthesis integral membrane protein MurJ [Candidatus Omnitrophota bacterium]
MSKTKLIRSTGIIAAATAMSRVLGFARDIIFANFLGTSAAAQAFVVAFKIPNALRDLVGEGAANAAVVPVLSECRTLQGDREFIRISQVLFNISFVVLSVLTVLGVAFSPAVIRMVAPGFSREPALFALTVHLNRVIFPYLVLIGLTASSMGILNAIHHFAAPAFGSCLLNIALIATTMLYPWIGVTGLAVGVLVGGALQLALNVRVMYRKGIAIDARGSIRHPAVDKIGRLLVPRILGSAVYQLNVFVSTILASFSWIVGSGAIAALYYANRLVQFPLAIFGIALAQAALPKMSQEFAAKDIERFKDTLSFSLRSVLFVMLPASFGLAVLGRPIVRVLFERGEFTAYSTAITESALFYYVFGLCAYGGVKLLVSSFYSMHDTKTPVKAAFVSLVINIAASLIFMWRLKLGGLALATSISAFCNFMILYVLLERKLGDFGRRRIIDSFLRCLGASIIMAVALKALLAINPDIGAFALFTFIAVSIAVFLAAAYLFKAEEIRSFIAWASKRR